MANEKLKGISLSIGLEISDFKSNLNEIKRQITLATDAVKFWKQQLKLDPSNTVYLQQFNKALEELTDVSQEAKTKVKQAFDEFTKAGASPSDERVKATVRELNSLDNTLNKAIPDYKEFANTIENGNGSLEKASGNFDEASDSASRLGDIIKGNLISDAIKTGIRELVDLTKELAGAYLDLIKNGIEYNANMEKYSVSIHAIGEANGEAKENIDDLIGSMKELGAKSSFGVDTLLEVSQQLMASGVSADEAGKDITNLSKILAYAGKGSDELKRMAQNMNQIKNAGKAMSVDLKQFAYSGVPVYKLLADYSDDFKNITKDTIITYEDLSNAFDVASQNGSQYFNAIDVQAGTLSGQIAILKNQFNILSGTIAEDTTSALQNDFLPVLTETLENMNTGFKENGTQGLIDAFSEGLSNLAPVILEKAPELLQDGIDIANGIIDGLLQEDENGDTLLEKAAEELIEMLTTWSLDPDTWLKLFDIGWNLAKGIAKGFWQGIVNIFKDNPELSEAFSGSFSSLDFGGNRSGGWGNSGGFGALQSGGYGNQITLNASFVANGNLDESQALRFADLMTERINQNLGGMI